MNDGSAEVVELEQRLEQVSRVAAVDIAKASAMVCTRGPNSKNPDRRVQRTWPVAATTAAINELADHLVCEGVQLVVMEATGVFYKPFFYRLEARGLRVWLVNARDVKNVPGRGEDRQAGRAVAGQTGRARDAASQLHPAAADPAVA